MRQSGSSTTGRAAGRYKVLRVCPTSVDKFDKQTILRLAAGAKLAVVVGPFPLVGVMLANVGLKVFCSVSATNLRSFCEGCRSLLYTGIFPLVGDHAKIPSAMPIKVDMAFFDTPEKILGTRLDEGRQAGRRCCRLRFSACAKGRRRNPARSRSRDMVEASAGRQRSEMRLDHDAGWRRKLLPGHHGVRKEAVVELHPPFFRCRFLLMLMPSPPSAIV